MKTLFYLAVAVTAVLVGKLSSDRVKNWERGQPDDRRTTKANAKKRAEDFRAGVWMQTLLRDPAAGIMHSLLYFGFVWLFIATVLLEANHQFPPDLKFLHGDVYKAYSLTADLAGVAFVVGILWAIGRRYLWAPYRIWTKTKPEDAIILGVFLLIGVTGFLAEGFRIALVGRPTFEKWSIIGWPISAAVDGWTATALARAHRAMWGLHFAGFLTFLVLLPTTKLRHMFTSPMNMYLRDRARPKGAMKPLPNLMETELESFGASKIEDFTWKQLMDTDACTICGRCTSVCPANKTGKPLDPREIVLKVGEVMAATASPKVPPPVTVDADITIEAGSVLERITAEEVWACTTCKACDEICPVNIEILDKILDIRRYYSLMESNFPTELGNAYRGMENSSNPWQMNQARAGERGLAGLPDEVPIVDPSSGTLDHEYLYWVGCATSFDDRNKKVAVATAKLLQRAGVDFAILGQNELCTGDPARRSGNEYVFQMLAVAEHRGPQRARGAEDHRQLPPLLQHAEERVPRLRRRRSTSSTTRSSSCSWSTTGRLSLTGASLDERIAYHDSCYLGPPQRRVPRPPQGDRVDRRGRGRRDAPQRHPGPVLRRRRRPHVHGGADGQEGQHRAHRRGARHRRRPHRRGLPVLHDHAGRRREGEGRRRGGQGLRHLDDPPRGHREHPRPRHQAALTPGVQPGVDPGRRADLAALRLVLLEVEVVAGRGRTALALVLGAGLPAAVGTLGWASSSG